MDSFKNLDKVGDWCEENGKTWICTMTESTENYERAVVEEYAPWKKLGRVFAAISITTIAMASIIYCLSVFWREVV